MPRTLASAPSSSGAVEAPVQHSDAELLAEVVRLQDMRGQRLRDRFGISGAGEAAHGHIRAGRISAAASSADLILERSAGDMMRE